MAAGILFCILVLVVVDSGLSGSTIITDPQGVPETAEKVMQCIRQGEWDSLSALTYGAPIPVPAVGADGTTEKYIWDAYQQSLQWSVGEELQVSGPCVSVNVALAYLDIQNVSEEMAQIMLETSENNQQEQLLDHAVRQVLGMQPVSAKRDISLTFVREENQWKVVPNKALLEVFSGFTSQ